MLTLLQINVDANRGSHGIIAEEIGNLAINQGWRSIIAYGRRANPSTSELIRIGSDFDVMEHGLESRLFDNHGLASRRATRAFIKRIEEINPSIIHLHNIHGYYLNYRILFEYLNATKIPVVWTLHDCWPFTGHCAHFVTAKCDKWKTQCSSCPIITDYPKSYWDRSCRNYEMKRRLFSANENLKMVAVCDWIAGIAQESFLKGRSVDVIKNGIDLDVFVPGFRQEGGLFQILGVSGSWTQDKGLYDFYRLRELLPPEEFEITLIGLSKKQIAALPKGIRGLERTESLGQLAQYYSAADVYINPTYADTFPTVNLEAMACGTPVITYRTGGSPESISPDTGWVLEKGDVNGIANIVKSLSSIGIAERNSQRQACRKRAAIEFDKDSKYKSYLYLYKKLTSDTTVKP